MALSLVPRLHGRFLEKTEKIIKLFIVLLFFKCFVMFLCLLKKFYLIRSRLWQQRMRYSLLALIVVLANCGTSIAGSSRLSRSKYEYRRASELLRNIRNIRIVWGKHFISVTYENERIPIKNSLPYTNVYICPVWFMGRFMTVL